MLNIHIYKQSKKNIYRHQLITREMRNEMRKIRKRKIKWWRIEWSSCHCLFDACRVQVSQRAKWIRLLTKAMSSHRHKFPFRRNATAPVSFESSEFQQRCYFCSPLIDQFHFGRPKNPMSRWHGAFTRKKSFQNESKRETEREREKNWSFQFAQRIYNNESMCEHNKQEYVCMFLLLSPRRFLVAVHIIDFLVTKLPFAIIEILWEFLCVFVAVFESVSNDNRSVFIECFSCWSSFHNLRTHTSI